MIDMRYRDNSVPNMLCAVGISELRPVIRRMEAGRTKAFLGINGIDVTPEISKANDIPKTEILHMAGLIVQLENAEPGQNVILHIMRRNGGSFEEVQVPVSLQ